VHRTRKNGGAKREGADESFEWGIAPNEGYEVVLDNEDIVRLMHHFKRQEYAAIDGKHALPDELPMDEEPVSDTDPPKSEVKLPSEPQDSDKSDADESDNQAVEPSAEETTASAEETASDSSKSGEKTEKKGPFVDIQLQRAIEAIEKRIEPAAVRQAA
jgi:hypothetical protein